MPRDYASTSRNKHPASLPGWMWMLGGLFIGLFIAFLVYLDHTAPNGKADISQAVSQLFNKTKTPAETHGKSKSKTATPPKQSDNTKKPRFDFYTILPELEVAIPEEELAKAVKNPGKTPHPAGQEYVLQTGSFRDPAQADRLKARLALQGIEAAVQTVSIKNGETWHRVRVGPIKDIATLNRTRKRLSNIGVPSIVVKNKS